MRDQNQVAREELVHEQGLGDYKYSVLSQAVIQMDDAESSSNLMVDVCVEAMERINIEEPPSSHQIATTVAIQGNHIANMPRTRLPKRPDSPRKCFCRYVSAPPALRNRIQVSQHQVEVSRSTMPPAYILSRKGCRAQKPFLVRKVRPRPTFSRRPIPPIIRTGWRTVNKSVTLAGVPEILGQDRAESVEEMLHLRGGCGGWMGKKGKMRQLEDDEELPPMIWWLAGGKLGHSLPTGSRLRWWKARSKGQWPAGQSRGYLQEFTYVLSDGKLCRDSPDRKQGNEKKSTKEKRSSETDAPAAGESPVSTQE